MSDIQQFFSSAAWFAVAAIIYIAIIAFGLIFFARLDYAQHRLAHPRRHRLFLAAFLTLVFTPSILPDWLIPFIPAPATFGLILVAPDLVVSNLAFSGQPGILLLYIYPLLFGFAIFYTFIFFRDWCRDRRSKRRKSPNTALEPTATAPSVFG
jgi:hypothetical protein